MGILKKRDGFSVIKKQTTEIFKILTQQNHWKAIFIYVVMLDKAECVPSDKKEAVCYYKIFIEKELLK